MDGMTHSQRRHHVIVDMYKSGKTQKQVGEELRASTWWHTRGTDAKYHSFTKTDLYKKNPVLLEKSVDKRTYKGSISKLNKLVARHNHYASQINKEQLQLDLIDSWDISNADCLVVNADGTPKYTWKEIAERNSFSTGFIQDHVKTKTRKTVSA